MTFSDYIKEQCMIDFDNSNELQKKSVFMNIDELYENYQNEQSKTVWVVTHQDNSCYNGIITVSSVFDSEEKSKEFVSKQLFQKDYEIDNFDLNKD